MNREILLGHTEDGERVTVEIALHPAERPMQTVTHGTADAGVRLSITGSVYASWQREPDSAGQCTDELLRVTKPHGSWTLDEIRELHAVWQRWHLNDMRAGCVHQTKLVYEESQYGRRVDLNGTTAANDCPAGYKYGSAWLYEPLPDDVIEQVHRWQRRLTPSKA